MTMPSTTRLTSLPLVAAVTAWVQARQAVVLDVLVAAVTTGIEIGLVIDGWPSYTVTALVLTVLSGLVLGFRRRAPVAVLALTGAVTAAVVVTSGGGYAGGAPVIVALFTVAERRERWIAIAALLPTAVLLQAWAVSAPPVSILAVILGAYLQTRRRYVAALQERTAHLEREREQLDRIAAQEERASIARELHDIVAHSVTVMLLGVRGARDVLRTSPDVAEDTLRRVETSAEQSLAELRRILLVLRDPDRPRQEPAQLRPAPSLGQLDELVTDFRSADLPVRLEVVGERRPLPQGVELSVYRIVEEALTNVIKHAYATTVVVRLRFADATLEVSVENDGEPRTGGAAGGSGHGITGMRERVAALGGELEAGSRTGGGFRVGARLPIGDAE